MGSNTDPARVRLIVAYDGASFHGWQHQPGLQTVEGALAAAVEKLAHRPIRVWGASRTDAGVHALGQVAAFDDPGTISAETWYRALNKNTPEGLVVRRVDRLGPGFHPRHCARGKIYRYRISTGFHQLPGVGSNTWHVHAPLDVAAMQAAGARLEGVHDFASFQGAGCDAVGTVRQMFEVSVRQGPDGRIDVQVAGSAFLKYMVRNLVGTLVEVGRGRRAPPWIDEVLEARDRRVAGMTAPPHGLTLVRVFHPGWAAGAEVAGERI